MPGALGVATRDPNLLKPLLDSGIGATNGFRTPADIERLKRQGYKPAAKSHHLDGDAVDLVPGSSGLSMRGVRAKADAIANGWPGGRAIPEGDHIHLQLPGWGMAPGTPGTPNAGMPPLPAGFVLKQRGSLRSGNYQAPGALAPSGAVHDGDTFGLASGGNARLTGVDAFELAQTGRRDGKVTPLGVQARDLLTPFAMPPSSVTPTGAMTYGRPVVALSNGQDAGRSLLLNGLGIATPQYLRNDTGRLGDYMEAERGARLNRRGAFDGTFQTPSSFRHDGPWAEAEFAKAGENGIAVFNDEPLPFQGLRPEIASGYRSIWQDMKSKPEDLLAFAKASGFTIDPAETRKAYADRAKTNAPGGVLAYKKAPRVLTDPGDGKLGTTVRGFGDPFNILDEAGGLLDTLGGVNPGRESLWNSDRRFGDILANNIDQNRSVLAHDDATHPYYRMGGQLASGIALPIGGGARTALQLARAGAIEGGFAGFGAGEGGVTDRLPGATLGAGLGAAGGAALGSLGGVAANALRRHRGQATADLVKEEAPDAVSIPNDGIQNAGSPLFWRPLTQGSRQRDYIDLGDLPPLPAGFTHDPALGNVKAMDARATPSQMADIAERTQPGDVLPVPYNRVNTLDEHLAANPGNVRDVEAPDELAMLETRRFPSSGKRPIYQRGPVDLAGFLRSQGGIRDQGGELAHMGIDNAQRVSDFTGTERFLGRLVQNDGMNLDDAALHAWEAGYFPDHATRPTVDEFVSALGDTHSGFSRRFLPDDLEEVARFEGAREQRNLVERAQADGVRLGEEVGEPVGLADLEANQPPVTAYEDLPTLGGRAGNIDLDKLETRGDIRRALQNTESMFGGFDAARRGKVSHAETAALADELGMRADDLLKRRQGQALNAEQALGARRILARSGDELVALAAKAKGGSDADLATFQKAMLRHAAIQEQVSGATAEAGRALSQFKMAARSKDHHESIMRAIVDSAGGRRTVEDVAGQILELQKVPGALNKFALDAVKPTWKDKAVELYYNSLLSSPATHAVNILSNAMTAVLSIPEEAAASALGLIRLGSVDRVMASELGPRIVGLMQGAMEGLKAARLTFKTGRVPDHVTKVEAAMQEAIPGKLGHVLRTPTRALSAEDEFFKAVARRSELASLAVRKARGEGLQGEELTARIDELTRSPDAEMMDQAMEFARYQTFQKPVGTLAGPLLNATRSHPWLKLVVPFIRTPTNILKFAAERSPLAPLLKDWRADILAGGARRDLAIARSTLGTGLGLTIANLAHEGLITGGGPADDNAKRIKLADGWQPYSFKIGDKYYSYQRLDPLATTIGVAADYVDKQSAMTDRQRDESAMLLAASIIQNLSDKTWLSGLSDALAAIQDPMRNGPWFFRKTAAGIVTPAASGQLARTIDPTQRETKTVAEAVKARIPGVSSSLRPKLDVWGRAITKDGGVGPDIMSPIYTSTQDNDPVTAEALAIGLRLGDPARKVGGRDLTNVEFHRYREMAGQLNYIGMANAMAGAEWRTMSTEEQFKAATEIKNDARKQARGILFGGVREIALPGALAPSSPPVARSGTSALPAGFGAMPALPPGFALER